MRDCGAPDSFQSNWCNQMQISRPLSVEIAGLGSYVPDKVLTNEDLEHMVETSDEWITRRTGIKERRLAAEDQATSDLAIEAARKALADADMKPSDLDAVITATCTPDYLFPATACLVQAALGAQNAMACDIEAACSGFVYAFAQASAMVSAGTAKNVLFIGTESLSRFTNYDDRRSCILFGDGAGAAIVRPANGSGEVIYGELGAEGSDPELLMINAGGARNPASEETVKNGDHYMHLRGREVFRLAVNKLTELIQRVPERTGISLDEIRTIIPHQSNIRIIQSACQRAGIAEEKAYMNIDRYGNTSAASVPLALYEARENGAIERGDLVLLLAFGGGLTWGSLLLRY